MSHTLEIARALAAQDNPLLAREVLQGEVPEANDLVEHETLLGELNARLAHLRDRNTYQQFYGVPTPERTFMDPLRVPHCHLTMRRWGIIREQMEEFQANTILELGCLDGFTLLNYAIAHPDVQCIGVDLGPHAVGQANALAQHYGVKCKFLPGFLEDVNFGKKCDTVLLLEVLEHVINVESALGAAERNLAKDGRVYISTPLTPTSASPHGGGEREQREHVRLIDYAQMMKLTNENGRRMVFYAQLHTPDGMHHVAAYQKDEPEISVSFGGDK